MADSTQRMADSAQQMTDGKQRMTDSMQSLALTDKMRCIADQTTIDSGNKNSTHVRKSN